jgi:outer membrane receptor for Fe3+-dicitrate
MANEIYHKTWWGNTSDSYWGDVYYEPNLTNHLSVRVDYYENSNETDELLNELICRLR